MTTDNWYYSAGEAQHGPYTQDQVRGLLRDRKIDRDTYMWTPAMSGWTPLAETELASLLGGGAPGRAPVASPAPPPPSGSFGETRSAGAPLAPTSASRPGGLDLGTMEQGAGFPGVMIRAARRAIQEKYFNFEGRAGLPEYWWYVLFAVGLAVAAQIIDVILVKIVGVGFVGLLLALALLLPGLGAAARRLHDTDRSGWWLLLSLVPFVGAIVVLVFLCLPGTPGGNRFGPPPRPV